LEPLFFLARDTLRKARQARIAYKRTAAVSRFTASEVSIETASRSVYPEGMSNEDVARFRRQADESRQMAERAINPLDKEAWLRLAGEWIKMAQESELRTKR
jgi:hypothetical protein